MGETLQKPVKKNHKLKINSSAFQQLYDSFVVNWCYNNIYIFYYLSWQVAQKVEA